MDTKFSIADLQAAHDAAATILRDGPRYKDFGICFNMRTITGEAESSYDVVSAAAASWPHTTGDYDYPVPDPQRRRGGAWRWEGRQREYREDLLHHIIAWCICRIAALGDDA